LGKDYNFRIILLNGEGKVIYSSDKAITEEKIKRVLKE